MSAIIMGNRLYNREIAFCKVYSLESKEKLEKVLLKNRISYFIEWQEKTFFRRIFGKESAREKNVFTIRINEADAEKAKELVEGMESVKLHRADHNNDNAAPGK